MTTATYEITDADGNRYAYDAEMLDEGMALTLAQEIADREGETVYIHGPGELYADGYEIDPDVEDAPPEAAPVTEARTVSRYSIQMVDGEEPADWMRLLTGMTPGPQDSGRVHIAAEVPVHLVAQLERALDGDDDVIEYVALDE